MPPRDPQPAIGRRKSKPNLDMPELELAEMLEQYCDLRRRSFDQQAIQTKASWSKNHQKLLLKEAQRRDIPGSQASQAQAVTEWLLAMYDAGTELRVIQRASAYTSQQTEKKLQTALDAASGPAPTGLIIRNPDGTPARVSWLDANGNLMHRPFDGAFPPNYPAKLALRQCTEVAQRLVGQRSKVARDRAYTMLLMAEDGLHSFDHDAGRKLYTDMEEAELEEDAKRTVILNAEVGKLLLHRCGMRSRWLTGNGARTLSRRLRDEAFSPALTRRTCLKLHPNAEVGKLLLHRCGMRSRWLTGNGARTLSRRLRDEAFSPALTRNLLEHLEVWPESHWPGFALRQADVLQSYMS